MSTNHSTIVTNVGLTKIANAIASGTKLTFATMAFGDSNNVPYKPSITATSLQNEVYRVRIDNVTSDGANTGILVVEGVISSPTRSLTINEVGIFDDVGAMIAVGIIPEIQIDHLSTARQTTVIRFKVAVSNTSAINFTETQISAHDLASLNNTIVQLERRIAALEQK